MKTILVMTPRFPFPVVGGDKLRIYEICKQLSQKYNLILLTLCDSKNDLVFESAEMDLFKEIHRVYLPKWKSYVQTALSIFSSTPLQVAYYSSSVFQDKFSLLEKRADLLLCHLIRTAEYAKSSKKHKIIEMTDAISMNYGRLSDRISVQGFRKYIYQLERYRLHLYEKNIINYFDWTFLVSNVDRNYLINDSDNLKNKVIVCRNGVDTDKYKYNFFRSGQKIVFIGNMYSLQNLDAALWFATSVLPQLRKHGNYIFKVIGKIPDDDFKKLSRIKGVEVTGAVDDVAEYAKGAIAGICSVRLAAGIQNKILEYMAMGIPTITSSIGYEGLDAKVGKDILIADSPDEYVEHVLSLNKDVSYSHEISENALNYVQKEHSWAGSLEKMMIAIEKLQSEN